MSKLLTSSEEIWPKTPHPALRGRSPLEAGKAGDSETSLRALVNQLEAAHEQKVRLLDWNLLRAKLQQKPEPTFDPERVELDQLHLSRLSSIPIEQLDDDRLLALYRRSREWGLRSLMNRAARLIDQKPSLLIKGQIENVTLYGDLALEAAQDNDRALAASWLARGRDSESPQKRSAHVLSWEMIELQVEMLLDGPEIWVPRLAVILERYRQQSGSDSPPCSSGS